MTPTPHDASRLKLITLGQVGVVEMTLDSTLDSDEFDELNLAMTRLLAGGAGQWVLDLAGVRYAGSSLLGLLLNVRQQVHAGGGRLVMCGLSPKLRSVFAACSLEGLFKIRRTRDDALRCLGH